MANLSVILLHDKMLDKQGNIVTTSLTFVDLHDISRSSKTYGLKNAYFAHPSPSLRKLVYDLQGHWDDGAGGTYNPDRKEALTVLSVVQDLDEALHLIALKNGKPPKLIATSAHNGSDRISFDSMRSQMNSDPSDYLMMLGTGWGMSEELLSRADYFLEPIEGSGSYNHLSVRSACAILLDRLLG